MPRIAGHDIPDNKKINFSLRYIYGVGSELAEEIVKKSKINPDKRAKDLTGEEINRIQLILDSYLIEGDLRREINDNVARLKRIQSYRGMRHSAGLPARGQRTRSNARTKRGARRTIGAMTKEAASKLEETKKA
ncbi:MAG: 30S ribosomal protein S13 [Candidatus Pacebacteria bacterium]|jgi:small subunit ribosomal protein S13|nr:30S ribosomal protein S13 [Candidatus Paceibacterota bacterium]